ncbi:hypothetical protein VPHD81_0027 [Vibrio phage D81]
MTTDKRYDGLSRKELIETIEMLKRSYKAVSQDTTTIEYLLTANYGNLSKTARDLGINRGTLSTHVENRTPNRVQINKDGSLIPLLPTQTKKKGK